LSKFKEAEQMTKRLIQAGFGILVAWAVLDFILHGWLLRSTYEATAKLWRPMDQMNIPLIYGITLVLIACFVLIYGLLIGQKSLATGVRFGALFGLVMGVASGFGTYVHMPIPLLLAWAWFLGGWIKGIVAGAIVGVLVKPEVQATA
jgi:hypothetical protein